MPSTHRDQVFKEIKQIAVETLGENDVEILDINALLHERTKKRVDDPPTLYWPDPVKLFHAEPRSVGIVTLDKEVQHIFALFPHKHPKVTIALYWKSWFWYGTFKMVTKSVKEFFRRWRDHDPTEALACPVCLETGDHLQLEYAFRCTHLFCVRCIPQVIETSKRCPLCRRNAL